MKRRGIVLLLLLCVLTACSTPFFGGVKEPSPDISMDIRPIPPSGDELPFGEMDCVLYFRYKQEGLLTSASFRLSLTANVSLEQAIVERLIAGPGEGRYDLTATIHPDTKVLSVRENNGYLSITLSEEFLMVPGTTAAWRMPDGIYDDEALINRRMAVYSIVNSITELGSHSRIMLQIGSDNSGASERIKRQQAGFDTLRDQPINPLTRDTSCIYTPERSLQFALEALKAKDWESLDAYIASYDIDGSEAPSRELFADLFGGASLIEYSIHSERTQSYDGTQTTICVDCTFRETSGSTTKTTAYEWIPVRLVRDADIWRVAYQSMRALLPATPSAG